MPDRMEMLREASERGTPGTWPSDDPNCMFNARNDLHFADLAVNFVRDLLSGTWPDQEAVERARTAIAAELDRDDLDPFYRLDNAARAAIAALGLTVLERG